MFDIGWMELMVIGVVALIVVGPKDLPEMFRQVGRFTAKMRQMGREFSRAMEQAANDSGVNDVKKDLKAATAPLSGGMQSLKSAADKFEKWDPVKGTARPTTTSPPLTPPPMPATPAATPVAAASGPATQALYDKQAARQSVLRETTEKLKAIETGAVSPGPGDGEAVAAPPKRSPGRTRTKKAVE
jgi:sec-independent protein translocase protein TatB